MTFIQNVKDVQELASEQVCVKVHAVGHEVEDRKRKISFWSLLIKFQNIVTVKWKGGKEGVHS